MLKTLGIPCCWKWLENSVYSLTLRNILPLELRPLRLRELHMPSRLRKQQPLHHGVAQLAAVWFCVWHLQANWPWESPQTVLVLVSSFVKWDWKGAGYTRSKLYRSAYLPKSSSRGQCDFMYCNNHFKVRFVSYLEQKISRCYEMAKPGNRSTSETSLLQIVQE